MCWTQWWRTSKAHIIYKQARWYRNAAAFYLQPKLFQGMPCRTDLLKSVFNSNPKPKPFRIQQMRQSQLYIGISTPLRVYSHQSALCGPFCSAINKKLFSQMGYWRKYFQGMQWMHPSAMKKVSGNLLVWGALHQIFPERLATRWIPLIWGELQGRYR